MSVLRGAQTDPVLTFGSKASAPLTRNATQLMPKIKTIKDVVDWRMCVGCGACYSACRKGAVSLVNVVHEGIRPRFADPCVDCTDCLEICPGYQVEVDGARNGRAPDVGPFIEVWVGHATDPEIRHAGSSGGVLSALAVYCLEHEDVDCVLHTGTDDASSALNKTVLSRNREDVLARTGSRYAPASPCDGVAAIAESNLRWVFIGKPCDASGLHDLRKKFPEVDRNLSLAMTFFCAGTPSTNGTLELLSSLGYESVPDSIRYRGNGWPGAFTAASGSTSSSLSYERSWGALTSHRPLRCNLCPDGVGRVADISCGDAWHLFRAESQAPGLSLVVVRSPRGQEIVRRAAEAGYVTLERTGLDAIRAAQVNLLERHHQLFGRLAALRAVGIPIPRYRGFGLMKSWLRISLIWQARSLLGTFVRAIQRKWWRRHRPNWGDVFDTPQSPRPAARSTPPEGPPSAT